MRHQLHHVGIEADTHGPCRWPARRRTRRSTNPCLSGRLGKRSRFSRFSTFTHLGFGQEGHDAAGCAGRSSAADRDRASMRSICCSPSRTCQMRALDRSPPGAEHHEGADVVALPRTRVHALQPLGDARWRAARPLFAEAAPLAVAGAGAVLCGGDLHAEQRRQARARTRVRRSASERSLQAGCGRAISAWVPRRSRCAGNRKAFAAPPACWCAFEQLVQPRIAQHHLRIAVADHHARRRQRGAGDAGCRPMASSRPETGWMPRRCVFPADPRRLTTPLPTELMLHARPAATSWRQTGPVHDGTRRQLPAEDRLAGRIGAALHLALR